MDFTVYRKSTPKEAGWKLLITRDVKKGKASNKAGFRESNISISIDQYTVFGMTLIIADVQGIGSL